MNAASPSPTILLIRGFAFITCWSRAAPCLTLSPNCVILSDRLFIVDESSCAYMLISFATFLKAEILPASSWNRASFWVS